MIIFAGFLAPPLFDGHPAVYRIVPSSGIRSARHSGRSESLYSIFLTVLITQISKDLMPFSFLYLGWIWTDFIRTLNFPIAFVPPICIRQFETSFFGILLQQKADVSMTSAPIITAEQVFWRLAEKGHSSIVVLSYFSPNTDRSWS